MRPSKRIFDLSLAVPGLLALAPFFGLIAAAIKLGDGGPIFYRQERIGLRGNPFRVWKFRTMRHNAGGEPITMSNDPRVTPIGRWLRRHRLDELPQVINVVMGEMSLVGPRPEVAKYAAHYTLEQRHVLDFTPGITDPAVFKVRDYREKNAGAAVEDLEEIYIRETMPEKVRLSIEYAESATLWTDFVMIVRTLVGVVR